MNHLRTNPENSSRSRAGAHRIRALALGSSALAPVFVLLVLALATGCRDLAGGSAFPGAPAGRSQAVPSAGPTSAAPAQDPRELIARLEDARSDGDGLLETYLTDGTEATRERAAVALGRIPSAETGASITRSLSAALADRSPSVRAAAAFALGERGDPAAAEALAAARSDADPTVRARVVEAASRLDDAGARRLVLQAVHDPALEVRQEAVIGPSRWKRDAPDAEEADRVLVAAANSTEKAEVEIVWRALYSLARRKCAAGRAAFEAGLDSPDARARIFAAQGLRSLPIEAGTQAKLRAALSDADWRVACEAGLTLGEHPDPAAVQDLAKALAHVSPHVRRTAAEALAQFTASKEAVLPILVGAKDDASVDVRCSVLVARAELHDAGIAAEIEAAAKSRDPLWRGGAAGAADSLEDPAATTLLVRLSRDESPRVADVAAHALEHHKNPEAHARLVEMLADKDNGVRLAAAGVLKDVGTAEDLPALYRCLETSRGPISAEIDATIVDAAGWIGGEPARPILERGSFHESSFVRHKARALLAKEFPGTKLGGPTSVVEASSSSLQVPIPGTDYPASGSNPRVEIVTNRGSMVFELLRDETPVHVFAFLALARKGFYDGTTFHRIVPDFVIQGGDPRGDGNGDTTWRGAPLRGEFTPRKYVRGSLGMPRNDDPDSGGCQIFVTHRETPQLDGRYTLFGEMRAGFDVLDRIELGDVIRSVRILGEDGAKDARKQ